MESKHVSLDVLVHYIEEPGPEAGPTFVFVHGLGGSHANWLALAPLLARHGRVLAPDLPGFGFTPVNGRPASVELHRETLDRFVEEVAGEPVVLVGNSMGGLVSLIHAAERPGTVRALVPIAPAVVRPWANAADATAVRFMATYLVPPRAERWLSDRVRARGAEALVDEMLAVCSPDPSRIPAEVRDAIVEVTRVRLETMPWATPAFLQGARSIVRTLVRRRWFRAMIGRIQAPTLLMHGAHDRLVPLAAAHAMSAMRPDWPLRVFDDLGHVPQMEDPARVADEIATWLSREPALRS